MVKKQSVLNVPHRTIAFVLSGKLRKTLRIGMICFKMLCGGAEISLGPLASSSGEVL
jgi:hypothetical protein